MTESIGQAIEKLRKDCTDFIFIFNDSRDVLLIFSVILSKLHNIVVVVNAAARWCIILICLISLLYRC